MGSRMPLATADLSLEAISQETSSRSPARNRGLIPVGDQGFTRSEHMTHGIVQGRAGQAFSIVDTEPWPTLIS